MVRWTKGYTAAATNTRKVGKSKEKPGHRPWQSHESNDRFIWLSCLVIGLLATLTWWQTLPDNKQPPPGAQVSPSVDLGTEPSVEESLEDPDSRSAQSSSQPSTDEPALLWWIESAPLPDQRGLQKCLEQAEQPLPELLIAAEGFSILTAGRPRPQTIYEQNEQIWIKTPLLASPHQQAYDHLLLISCLQTPGATLYDPLLVRQWGGETWPKRNQKSGGISLDELFIIRSQGRNHFTYGLHRLGLPELGILTTNIEARDLLKRLALFWIVEKNSRDTLQLKEHQFTFLGRLTTLVAGHQIPEWLGPKDTRIVLNQDRQIFTIEEVNDLVKVNQANIGTKGSKSRFKRKKTNRRRQRRQRRSLKPSGTRKKQRKGKSKTKKRDRPQLQYR